MKSNIIFQHKQLFFSEKMALFYIFANLFNVWLCRIQRLHLIYYDITHMWSLENSIVHLVEWK